METNVSICAEEHETPRATERESETSCYLRNVGKLQLATRLMPALSWMQLADTE
ncbi:MAG: hypothetical protein ACTS5A_03845 [Candidatus Hodgkinia cicadicola]